MGEAMSEEEKPWFYPGLKFQCTGCGECCTGSPGYVFLSSTDFHRLAEHFSLSPNDFAKRYTRLVDGQYALLDRPGSHDCILLKDKKCSAYEARPIQCRTFPWWMQHLKGPAEWEEAAQRCEGIGALEAPLVPGEKIEAECLTYLDNLLEENFSLC